MRVSRRAGLGLACLALVATCSTLLPGAFAASAAGSLPVIGFQQASDPVSAISRHASKLSAVSVDGVNITGRGRVSAVTEAELRQAHAARGRGLRTTLLLQNWSNAANNFSEALAHQTLSSASATSLLARRLSVEVSRGAWGGVTVDLESLWPRDGAGLVLLLQKLRSDLPGKQIDVTVSLASSRGGYAAQGYELRAIDASGARVILMAYDQHGPWEKQPGPIGALKWQRAGIKALLDGGVRASHLILGVAGYGYAWEPHRTLTVSVAGANKLVADAGSRERWAPSVGEWTASLPDGTVVWWSDGRSFRLRAELASREHLAGLAVWDLQSCGSLDQ